MFSRRYLRTLFITVSLVLLAGFFSLVPPAQAQEPGWEVYDYPFEGVNGIWGSSANDVYIVGLDGIAHYDGHGWQKVDHSFGNPNLTDIWGSSATDIYVVGNYGLNYEIMGHYDGQSWHRIDPGVQIYYREYFTDVWGSSANDVYVVSRLEETYYGSWVEYSRLLHYDGQSWDTVSLGQYYTSYLVTDIWGSSADDVYVVGYDGLIRHYDGQSWKHVYHGQGGNSFFGIWGSSADNVYIVGQYGTILHYDGQSLSKVNHGLGNNYSLYEIWGSGPDDIYAVGEYSTILHYDGQHWREVYLGLSSDYSLHSIWGSSAIDIYAAGSYYESHNSQGHYTLWHYGPQPVNISGRVTSASSGVGLDGISVIAYDNDQTEVARTTTKGTGEYALTGLSPGDYRLLFVDPSDLYRREYYQNRTDFIIADDVTVVDGMETKNIDIDLAVTTGQAPKTEIADIGWGRGIASGGEGKTVIVWFPTSLFTASMSISRWISCDGGETPENVRLFIGNVSHVMNAVGSHAPGKYITSLELPYDLPTTGTHAISARFSCNGEQVIDEFAVLGLYDPSGQITDAETGQPINGAVVNLYRIPGAQPDSGPTQDGDCRTIDSRPAGAGGPFGAWSGLPSANLNAGSWLNPELTPDDLSPRINPQHTGPDGRYAWDVVQGCWYVEVRAPGYETAISPLVGVPPEVADLDIVLEPVAGESVYLPLVVK